MHRHSEGTFYRVAAAEGPLMLLGERCTLPQVWSVNIQLPSVRSEPVSQHEVKVSQVTEGRSMRGLG